MSRPRRCASAIRCQRPRTRPEVGRNSRSNSFVRSTVPTIDSIGIDFSPRLRCPTHPRAATTSSNGRITSKSDGSRRRREVSRASACSRRAREKSVWASDAGKPVSAPPSLRRRKAILLNLACGGLLLEHAGAQLRQADDLALEALAVGDVVDEGVEGEPAPHADRRDADLHRELRAVAVQGQ